MVNIRRFSARGRRQTGVSGTPVSRPGARALRGRSLLTAVLLAWAGILFAAPLDLVLLLDDSAVVKQADPDRRLRDALAVFVRSLRADDRVAIILYDDLASPILPLTLARGEGRGQILDGLNALAFKNEYSNSAAGLERAIYELNKNGRSAADSGIILLQAGAIRMGDEQQNQTFRSWIRDVLTDNANHTEIPVHVISLGGHADVELGRHVSAETSGIHLLANEDRGIEETFSHLSQALMEDQVPTPEPTAAKPEDEQRTSAHEEPISDPEPEAASALEPEPTEPSSLLPAEVQSPAVDPEPMQIAKQEAETSPVSAPPAADRTQPGFPWKTQVVRYGPVVGILVLILLLAYVAWRMWGNKAARDTASEAGADEPRLVDIGRVTGRTHYVLSDRVARISRMEGQDSVNVFNVTIPDDVISREHAFIELRDGAYWLTDTGSNNGTFLNEERVRGSVKLSSGDLLRFATYAFRFEGPEPDSDAEAETKLAPARAGSDGVADPAEAPTQIAAGDAEAVVASSPDHDGDRTRIRPGPDDAEQDATLARTRMRPDS